MLDEMMDVAYLRLSSGDRDHEGESNSIDGQRRIVRAYAAEKLKISTLTEFIDDGFSGTNSDRPQFRALLKQVERKRVKTLIVKDLSRLGRNYLEAGYYLEYVFPLYGVRVIAVNDEFDSNNYLNTTIGLDVVIKNLINAQYSKDISVKIKSTVDRKKRAGEYAFGAVPFGYKKEGKNRIVIDPAAARIVRYVFELAIKGNTVTQIAKRLNEEKVITPSRYLTNIRKNYRISDVWNYEMVCNIMKNRIYTGNTEVFKSHVKKVGSDRVKMIPLEEREIVRDTHDAIITEEEFFEAQKVIKSNRKGKASEETRSLAGKMICACCGRKLFIGKRSNKAYLCATRRYASDSECAKIRCVEAEMERIVLNAVNAYIDLVDKKRRAWHTRQQEQRSIFLSKEKEYSICAKGIEKLKKDKLLRYEDYTIGGITKEEFMRLKEEMNLREAELELQKEELQKQIEEMSQVLSEKNDSIVNMKEYRSVETLDRKLVNELIEKIMVSPDGEVKIVWNFMDILGREVEELADLKSVS